MVRAIAIPSDYTKPVEVFNYDKSMSLDTMKEKVFSGTNAYSRMIDIMGLGEWKETRLLMAFDDEGLYNSPEAINIRAMQVYELTNPSSFVRMTVPLVGNYLLFAEKDTDDEEDWAADLDDDIVQAVQMLLGGPKTTITNLDTGEEEVIHSGW